MNSDTFCRSKLNKCTSVDIFIELFASVKQFVVQKDAETSTVYVCRGPDHPALYSETFFTGTPHWIDSAPPELTDRQRDRTLVGFFAS